MKTTGLIAAPLTPMREDGSLWLEPVGEYAQHLCAAGVGGAFICGTTGEGMSLAVAERKRVAEQWVRCAPQGLRVVVHVGAAALCDCRELAAHAAEAGADSMAAMAPFFFKPDGIEGLASWCEQIAAAAPNLPFYYYHMPSMTGFDAPVHEFMALAARRIPNFAGIKYTFEDLDDFRRCLEFDGGRYDVLFGRDELLLSALELGALGAVGSTYNFAPALYHAIIEAHRAGKSEQAKALQAQAVRMIDAFVHCGAHPLAAFKWFMKRVGVDCGPVRLPLHPPTDAQAASLEKALDACGAMEWIVEPVASGSIGIAREGVVG